MKASRVVTSHKERTLSFADYGGYPSVSGARIGLVSSVNHTSINYELPGHPNPFSLLSLRKASCTMNSNYSLYIARNAARRSSFDKFSHEYLLYNPKSTVLSSATLCNERKELFCKH